MTSASRRSFTKAALETTAGVSVCCAAASGPEGAVLVGWLPGGYGPLPPQALLDKARCTSRSASDAIY
jgi:hypothetical protein